MTEEIIQEYPKYFRKAIRGTVAGRVLNKKGDKEEFILIGNPQDEANQEDITVKIFDADAEEYFKKANKNSIIKGYLIEIGDYEMTLDEVNSVSDGFLKDLLKQHTATMKKRVNEFTSPIPVHRILEMAKEENKPVKTVQFLENVLSTLQDKPVVIPEKIVVQ